MGVNILNDEIYFDWNCFEDEVSLIYSHLNEWNESPQGCEDFWFYTFKNAVKLLDISNDKINSSSFLFNLNAFKFNSQNWISKM